MQLKTWMSERITKGTTADAARRMIASDPKLGAAEDTFRKMCVLESLLRNGGNQKASAESLGVCQHTVQRALRSLGISPNEFRLVAKAMQGQANANS